MPAADIVLRERGLKAHPSLDKVWTADLPSEVKDLVYLPESPAGDRDIAWAEAVIDGSDWPLLPNLLPLMPVDDRSFACVVLSDADGAGRAGEGAVVRWHLDVKDEQHQAALLDTDAYEYVFSVAEELRHRATGWTRVLEIGEAYQDAFISNDRRPRDFIVRPVRIACQNVIVALAAFNQDSAFNGLGVVAWQTCEVPHVATNEATRALTALMLCDAFKVGGTMEIRFDRPCQPSGAGTKITGHPEGQVPAAIRRFARTVGIAVGVYDPQAISPAEARDLFRAVTPMPSDLRARVDSAIAHEGLAPERICFALLTGTWHALELDFMLATGPRTGSIVSGGAHWSDRSARQAESETCRAAAMSAMVYNRLNNRDSAGSTSGLRVLEDDRQGVMWNVDGEAASVHFRNLVASTGLPWLYTQPDAFTTTVDEITVFPRSLVTRGVIERVRLELRSRPAALLVPRDIAESHAVLDVPVLACPDRLADLDKATEANLLNSRIART